MTDLDTPIARAFMLDPLRCTEADIEAIVADFRSKRHLYNSGVAQAGNTKKLVPKITLSGLTLGNKKP